MSARSRILITGSAGFIGAHTMRILLDLGENVWGLDNYSTYYAPSMKIDREASFGLRGLTMNADISNRASLVEIFEKVRPTIVINLAAQGGVRASKLNPLPYIESNQLGFLNLIELSRDYGVKKFIYASSSSVYGDLTSVPFSESSALPAPKSLYANSKLSNELIAQHYGSPEMTRIGLRFFTVYGPWGRPDMAMFRVLASCLLEKEFVLTASKTVQRDFTFIDDLLSVVKDLTQRSISNLDHEIINVAGGNPYSLNDLFLILEKMGLFLNILNAQPDSLDVKVTHGSVDKLKALGIPVPSTSLENGTRQTLEWISGIKKSTLNEWYNYNSQL